MSTDRSQIRNKFLRTIGITDEAAVRAPAPVGASCLGNVRRWSEELKYTESPKSSSRFSSHSRSIPSEHQYPPPSSGSSSPPPPLSSSSYSGSSFDSSSSSSSVSYDARSEPPTSIGASPSTPPTKRLRSNLASENPHLISKSKRITFHNSVSVLPIPLRTEYSTRASSLMWSSASELWENASRNALEFGSEGWNWKECLEDDRMIYWRNEKVHPVHFVNSTTGQQHIGGDSR
ncbi:hypothetical protein TrVE_jg12942 [Triparma verrucosa]|uniref:Uncharacterized protein n=2 Tax=Triparma TaxID=722752 RepID=A0A9W7BWG5_9STRA|nr:hypothetical protein TrVE_jg12942 [Triparma verrucosa]GMH98771.1 hypothetical protein TrST_g11136 [Triparma strigata]